MRCLVLRTSEWESGNLGVLEARRSKKDGRVEIFAPRSNPEHALWLETHKDHWKKFQQNFKLSAPSLGELRQAARSVIRGATEDRYCSSGRFSAMCVEDSDEKWLRLSLMFTPTSWVIDEGEVYE